MGKSRKIDLGIELSFCRLLCHVCECCFSFLLLLVWPLVMVLSGSCVKFLLDIYVRETITSWSKLEEIVFFPNKTIPSPCSTISHFFFPIKLSPFMTSRVNVYFSPTCLYFHDNTSTWPFSVSPNPPIQTHIFWKSKNVFNTILCVIHMFEISKKLYSNSFEIQ